MNSTNIKWCTYQGFLAIIEKFDVRRGMAYVMCQRSTRGGVVAVRQYVRISHLHPVNLKYYKDSVKAWLSHEYEKGK